MDPEIKRRILYEYICLLNNKILLTYELISTLIQWMFKYYCDRFFKVVMIIVKLKNYLNFNIAVRLKILIYM